VSSREGDTVPPPEATEGNWATRGGSNLRERAVLRNRLVVLFILSLFPALGAFAQAPDATPSPAENTRSGKTVERRLYVGMWTIHFRDLERGLDNNWLVALSWGRIYGGTFINSFGKRAYSVGMQRSVARWNLRIVSAGVGYRAGLVTGYNERLFRLAGETPVLPFVQPLIMLDANRLGLELSYSGVIASAGLNVRLGSDAR
jgi:hypothetical protein